ncbi:hypothetical protein A2U01_0070268, partial [Trifolium medium]|nr:hypothetical protein [Trifolium medium]
SDLRRAQGGGFRAGWFSVTCAARRLVLRRAQTRFG